MTDLDDRRAGFFIVGCQRSGTTLMRLVLECHSRIQCCDESTAYAVLAGRATVRRERPLLGLKVPCVTEQLADRVLWDPFVLTEAVNPYDGQPVIVMVRDVRDTVRSMGRLRAQGRPWIDARLGPSLRAKINRDAAFRQRYEADIAHVNAARHRKLARAAFYWRYKTDAIVDYLARGFPVLVVRYEDLVRQPALELLRVCGFLRVPWEGGLLQHERFAHAELNEDGLAVGGTDASRPIDDRSVDRWRESFTADEADEILRFAGELQTMLYPADVASDAALTTVAGHLPA